VTILDISAANPEAVGSIETPGSPNGLAIGDDCLYIADGDSGLQVLDIGDPSTPVITGSHQTPSAAYDVDLQGGLCYVACGFAGLIVVDVSNPQDIREIGLYDTPDRAVDVFVQGDYAYVADRYSGLLVVDISDPAHPDSAGSLPTSFWISNVLVRNEIAYITYGEYVATVDIGDPASPKLMDAVHIGFWLNDLAAIGDYIFATNGWDGIIAVNVGDPETLYTVAAYNTPGFSQAVVAMHTQLYIADLWDLLRLEVLTPSDAGPTDEERPGPVAFTLYYNYPNPFNNTTIIEYELTRMARTELTIYDLLGRRVVTLVDAVCPPGIHSAVWDGRNRDGGAVASGVYVYRLQIDDATASGSKKMILLK
jgi:hypothetical protein